MIQASVILSTYNEVDWLRKVFWGFEIQSTQDFEIIVADDGSGQETELFLKEYQRSSKLDVHRVWHPDRGFRKTEILNRAIERAATEYLIFTDGDCVPRRDFVATHLRRRRPGSFLSGGYYKLNRQVSEQLTREDIQQQRCFDADWLHQHGQPKSLKDLKLVQTPWLATTLNRLTPTKPTWNGHNASTWKRHVMAANGFDSRMKYGGEDREFGERLIHAGIRPIQVRYSAICVHLDHDRGYVTPEMIADNQLIREATRRSGVVRTPYGITALPKK